MKKVKVENGQTLAIAVKGNSAEALISQAIAGKVSVETIERLMAMRTQLKQEYAKEEFNRAMSDFQSECPTIQKTKNGGQTKGGKVAYKYAPLESIVEQVKDLIKKHGFSYGIQTVMTEKTVKVFCTVKHIAGHSEINDIELPLTTRTEIMSAPQVVAATVTFGKRYSFCNGFGIMTGDEDNDANTGTATEEPKPTGVKIDDAVLTTKPEATKRVPGKDKEVNDLLDNTPSIIKTDSEKVADLITAIKKEAHNQKITVGKFNDILQKKCGLGEEYDYESFAELTDLSVLENIYESVVKNAIARKK
jgi:hypothetical protein